MSSLSILFLLFCLRTSTANLEPTPSPYPLPTPSNPTLPPALSPNSPPNNSTSPILQPTPSPTPTNTTSTNTAYDVLAKYDLPVGLLPQGVIGYDLDTNSGEFSAYLNDDGICSFSVLKYEFRVQPRVTGVISRDRLNKIQGIYVKQLFFWINIHDIERLDDSKLKISAGFFTWIIIPVDVYRVSPSCST